MVIKIGLEINCWKVAQRDYLCKCAGPHPRTYKDTQKPYTNRSDILHLQSRHIQQTPDQYGCTNLKKLTEPGR